jgi:hypothetical protein
MLIRHLLLHLILVEVGLVVLLLLLGLLTMEVLHWHAHRELLLALLLTTEIALSLVVTLATAVLR